MTSLVPRAWVRGYTYDMRNNYITYIGAMWLHFNRLRMAALSTGVPTCSLAQLQVQDIEKQKQYRRIDNRLTESGNARSEQRLLSR